MTENENKLDNQISDVIQKSLDKIKTIAEAGTIFGTPIITPNGATIIPVSKLSLGFVVGGGEYNVGKNAKQSFFPLAASTGGGVTLSPVGFLVEEKNANVRFVPFSEHASPDALITLITSTISTFINKKNKDQNV